ncbi:chemotaxis protein CheX [Tumebacillus permanentifrigoris]|uniref:Chemotaxis protein CheX n=1 Tax=Tumebacillus permanentifrigoris TaxID=378543 RepID=A0A316D4N3_9BACL|nr:chemotaxis protein CheX [Tumebacillus permanentifrigoris]PWK06663.1 chemotaxis protein CheX [Tumebacillus permanentifrigoris]
MTDGAKITAVLNSVLESAATVIPMPITPGQLALVTAHDTHVGYSILIGVTGELHGRLVLDTTQELVSSVAETMFGMQVSGEMLDSFAGEFGNMLGGNMATKLSERGVQIDITPPTVISGNARISGFKKAFRIPITVSDKGQVQCYLIFED